jgi:hypothetical protein
VRGFSRTVARYGCGGLGSRPVPRVSLPIAGRCTASPPLAQRPAPVVAHTSRTCHVAAHAMTWFPWHARNFPHRLAPGYLSGHHLSSREHPAAAVRHGCLTVNSTPAYLSSPTRAAPHSLRTPDSSCARLLVGSSCQLAGVVSPAAAAGQPSTSSASRSSPEPTNHLSASPRPQ